MHDPLEEEGIQEAMDTPLEEEVILEDMDTPLQVEDIQGALLDTALEEGTQGVVATTMDTPTENKTHCDVDDRDCPNISIHHERLGSYF